MSCHHGLHANGSGEREASKETCRSRQEKDDDKLKNESGQWVYSPFDKPFRKIECREN